jgi:hypothetical protein
MRAYQTRVPEKTQHFFFNLLGGHLPIRQKYTPKIHLDLGKIYKYPNTV